MTQIPVFKPLLAAEEFEAARAALELGWLGMGSYVGQFEETLKKLCGADDRHVAAVSTGHAALHLSLLLAGCGPGDEVILPSFTIISCALAVVRSATSDVLSPRAAATAAATSGRNEGSLRRGRRVKGV